MATSGCIIIYSISWRCPTSATVIKDQNASDDLRNVAGGDCS